MQSTLCYVFSSPEEHYLRLLQLNMLSRNENELKQDNQSYEYVNIDMKKF